MDQLYFGKIAAAASDEKREVFGYATTESIDASGESIKLSAVKKALADFMKFPALRVMHKLVAAGSVKEAVVDATGLYIKGYVSDDDAWKKVKDQTFRGFSVGGKVLARDRDNSKIITAIRLDEISLVDRPQNPDAKIDAIKVGGFREPTGSRTVATLDPGGEVGTIEQRWLRHGEMAEAVSRMLPGPEKADAKRDLDHEAERIVSATHAERNQARAKARDERSKLFPQPHNHPALKP